MENKQTTRGTRTAIKPVDEMADARVVDKPIKKVRPSTGVVTDCLRLNLRKEANGDSAVLAVIPSMTEVTVDISASTDDFYKVHTKSGVSGFCMKKYIAIRK